MNARRASAGWLRRAVTENVGLKLIAIVGSLVLFVMRGTSDDTGIVSARVIAPARPGHVLVSEVPEQVHVTLSGSRALVNAVRSETLADVRIPDGYTERFFYIEPSQFDLPPGVTVDRVEPTAIPIQWAVQTEGRFRVEPVVDGTVAEGFARSRATVQPTSVTVRGSAEAISALSRVRTQTIDVSGLTAGEHAMRVPLMQLPRHAEYATVQMVTVTIVIEAEVASRVFEDVEVAIVGGAELEARPRQVDVTVRGPRARVDALAARRVIPYVDVNGYDPAQGARPFPLSLRPLPEELVAAPEPLEVLVSPRAEH
ncbi:MAG: YbbR-like domain-containing protein [Sandaracinaceae bacterium]|nr:YbbR-like domain-containing protein [Sandaracinaceae bacterium]